MTSFLDASPPRKLQKSRPANSPSPQTTIPRPPVLNPPSLSLPPITTLPSLQTSLSNSSPLTGPTTPSPSTAQILSAAARSVDYFGRTWEDPSGPKDFSTNRTTPTARKATFGPSPILDKGQGPEGEDTRPRSRGHTRHRSGTGKSSQGTGSSKRNSKQPSQKAMLSKALQKANTAVLLDNAQNFEGAMQAYSEACGLLQQVMLRSSGDEDRRKLEAIVSYCNSRCDQVLTIQRNTYTSRISELRKIAPHLQDDGKALPARPESGDYKREGAQSPDYDDEPAVIETATFTRIINDSSYMDELIQNRSMPSSQLPQRRESLLPAGLDSLQYRPKQHADPFGRSYSKSPMRERVAETNISLAPPMMDSQYMPPPLSPRRPSSPMNYPPQALKHERQQSSSDFSSSSRLGASPSKGHTRIPSNESMSWLDTIDESGGSNTSSVHSRTSSLHVRRKHIRAPSGETEAEFDAALDAAVEAAYDEGFEPMDVSEPLHYDYNGDDEVVANVRRKVEIAKERVRQTEREAAIQDALDRERRRLLLQKQDRQNTIGDDDYEGNEYEEEERMLEEMTRGYIMDDFEFGLQSKSALPRESDSSGFSGRTWHSSIGSNPTTAGTVLSTVAESTPSIPEIPILRSKTPPPMHPPPSHALPPPPPPPITGSVPPLSISSSQGVRSRRLSGQNAKALKIETTVKIPIQNGPLTQQPSMPPPRIPDNASVQPKTAGLISTRQNLDAEPPMPVPTRKASSPFPAPSPNEIVSPPTPTPEQNFAQDSVNSEMPRSGSPTRTHSRPGLRKNFSSSSLKNLKSRNLSVSNIDTDEDVSPNTPMSSQYARENSRLPAIPALPTPMAMAFKDKMNGLSAGGMFLFDSDIHSPDRPGSPNPLNAGAPIPLEPCPTEYLLRPFWLMRAFYQTIAHPRGGYLSTKLFVPRDVWRVKGVKIKGLEDKIAQCDYLTAALMKLAQVDTYDADAVLEEMQSLEAILEQVQATLSKRLGSEVGTQGGGGMFKDASTGDAEASSSTSKSGSVSSKSSSFSWRRLRSKNSGVGLSSSYNASKTPTSDSAKEVLTMPTLPMTSTSVAKVRFAKRDVSQVEFSGPNANYMSALARLFDAAQTIDQIARQVEDPGLRHADKTQVGLELCTRHAAEFFGFYICRFVLTDISLLLDKFIKRGSEWVLV